MIKRSPWICVYDAGGCNGCNLEVIACFTPVYDVERFGCLLKSSPRHADILIVQGIVNKVAAARLRRIYNQMARPRIVVAVGACALSGGVFVNSYNRAGPVDRIIPVDVYVPGCPPRPEAIIAGILKGIRLWRERIER